MRADNSGALIEAAQRRRADTLARATSAINQALADGEAITITAVAARAGVSRAWLYAESTLQAQLEQLRRRSTTRRGSSVRRATAQPASEPSLRTRLDIAHERIRRLTAENTRLQDQLSVALGRQRDAHVVRNESRQGP
ncbi:MAG: transposase [Pseudonocardiales bacterium]|nr:MAG: transposase [Pseudonocardiales bacterium]